MEEKCETCRWFIDAPYKDKFGNIGWRSITGAIDSKNHWGSCCFLPGYRWKEAKEFCGQWKVREQ